MLEFCGAITPNQLKQRTAPASRRGGPAGRGRGGPADRRGGGRGGDAVDADGADGGGAAGAASAVAARRPLTCVVAFSRNMVLALAGELKTLGLRVSCLFGKMPAQARAKQIALCHAGALDVIVATDVIGHGINLPIDDVIFAETAKFDGATTRPLAPWEAAQVAGRAGRGTAAGRAWVMQTNWRPGHSRCDPRLVEVGR